MSAYTTLYITRSKAREEFMKSLFHITDKDLEDFMDRLLEPRLYNCILVDDSYENNNDDVI